MALLLIAHQLIWFLPLVPLALVLRRDKKTAVSVVLSLTLAWVVSYLIKNFFYFPRPFIFTGMLPQDYLLDGTFPSGHTSASFSAAFAVLRSYRLAGLILLFIALNIGLSRVLIGVHYPTDVLGGVVIGLVSSLVIAQVLDRLSV